MKYHSRSPEEWRKIDEEKRKHDRIPQLRKRSWYFFFVNLILVAAVMVIIGLYRMMGVPPVSIYVKLDDEYTAGEMGGFEIRLVNGRSTPVKMIISDVSILISSKDRMVYSKDLKESLTVAIDPYDYVVLFRDSFVPDFEGDYRIEITLRTNIGDFKTQRTIYVKDPIELVLAGYEPFYFPGERIRYDVTLYNTSRKELKVSVSSGEIEVKKGDVTIDRVLLSPFTGEVPPGKAVLVYTYSPALNLRKGLYGVRCSLVVNGKEKKVEMGFKVIDESEVSSKGVKILFDYYEAWQGIVVKLFLVNTTSEDRFFEVKSADLIVTTPAGQKTFSTSGIRVWIPPNGKIELMREVVDADTITGISAVVDTGKGVITKEIGGGGK